MPIILPLRGRNGPEKRMARQTIRSSSHSLQKDPTTSKLHSPNLPGSPDTENYYVRNRRKHENRTRHMNSDLDLYDFNKMNLDNINAHPAY
ncbi:hypothetical protein VTP01DRAFT_8316 [Rhizomucor pusillus]|uniref:uncharacterized protein n=1 Tax=Rhizomucor pusillus TaxID=4840 RepID=UPI003743B8A5